MSTQGKWLSKEVGLVLAERRNALNLTQAEVAEAIRVQRTSISNIESGKQVLLLDVFYDICKKLELSPVVALEQALSNFSQDIEQYTEIDSIVKSIKDNQ